MFKDVGVHLLERLLSDVPVLLLKSFERSHVIHIPKKLAQDSNLMRNE